MITFLQALRSLPSREFLLFPGGLARVLNPTSPGRVSSCQQTLLCPVYISAFLTTHPQNPVPQVSPGSSCHGSANSYSSFGAESLSSLLGFIGFIVGQQPEEDVESDLERASDALGERVFSLLGWKGMGRAGRRANPEEVGVGSV